MIKPRDAHTLQMVFANFMVLYWERERENIGSTVLTLLKLPKIFCSVESVSHSFNIRCCPFIFLFRRCHNDWHCPAFYLQKGTGDILFCEIGLPQFEHPTPSFYFLVLEVSNDRHWHQLFDIHKCILWTLRGFLAATILDGSFWRLSYLMDSLQILWYYFFIFASASTSLTYFWGYGFLFQNGSIPEGLFSSS